MTPGNRALAYRRMRAPPEHGGVLIAPLLSEAGRWLAENRQRRQSYHATVAGIPLGQLVVEARAELLEAAWQYTSAYRDVERPTHESPILLAGHQPELFHPGVWFKNFVLGGLARRHGGVAINLLIDSDTVRSATLRVPGGSVREPAAHAVAFDAAGPEIPFEERTILDPQLFGSFGRRAAQEIAALVPDPLINELWPLVVEQSRQNRQLGLCLAQGRHRLEGQWGLQTLELPQSMVCELQGFHAFVSHLLAVAPQVREVYNSAVGQYRRANHIRSTSHPVPNLAAEGDWVETPLWIWSSDDPQRRRLFVRQTASELVLSDRRQRELRLPAAGTEHASTVEALAALQRQGIKLRTRALITTLWARLVLGDLFLHGIGGAKYDQVTDVLFETLFGLPPPAYLTVTATLHLPIDRVRVTADELRTVDQRLRELTYHPERHIEGTRPSHDDSAAELARLCREKAAWIATPQTRENARQRCRAIRSLNESLQPGVVDERRKLLAQREQTADRLRAEAVLGSREYSFCLHPARSLQDFMLEFAAPNA
jgi:hypothetical protein